MRCIFLSLFISNPFLTSVAVLIAIEFQKCNLWVKISCLDYFQLNILIVLTPDDANSISSDSSFSFSLLSFMQIHKFFMIFIFNSNRSLNSFPKRENFSLNYRFLQWLFYDMKIFVKNLTLNDEAINESAFFTYFYFI